MANGRSRTVCKGCGKPMRVSANFRGYENVRCPKCRGKKEGER